MVEPGWNQRRDPEPPKEEAPVVIEKPKPGKTQAEAETGEKVEEQPKREVKTNTPRPPRPPFENSAPARQQHRVGDQQAGGERAHWALAL